MYLVRPMMGTRLISVPATIAGKELLFVKDIGADVTLIKEDLVDGSYIIEGRNFVNSDWSIFYSLDGSGEYEDSI